MSVSSFVVVFVLLKVLPCLSNAFEGSHELPSYTLSDLIPLLTLLETHVKAVLDT